MNGFAHWDPKISKADLTNLELLALEVCKEHGVRKTQKCLEHLLALTEYYRNNLKTANTQISSDTEWHLKTISTSSAQLSESLKKLRESEHIFFPDFIQNELANLTLLLETLKSNSNKILQSKAYNKKINQRVTRNFIVTCLEFDIPIRWSKEYSNCSKTSSSYLLGAIFAVGGMTDPKGESAIKSANYYLGSERSGFTCNSEGLLVHVSFQGLRLMHHPFISETIQSVTIGGMPPSLKRIPTTDCYAHEIGLKHELVLALLQKQNHSKK